MDKNILEVQKRILKEEHLDTLTSIYNLTINYWEQGKWKEAIEIDKKVLEVQKCVFREEYLNTLTSIRSFAINY